MGANRVRKNNLVHDGERIVTSRVTSLSDPVIVPEIDRRPTVRDGTFLVVWVAWQENDISDWVVAPRRGIQLLFRRMGGRQVSNKLSALDGDFIEVNKPSNKAHAHEYRLHAGLTPDERLQWIDVGTLLYSPNGGSRGRVSDATFDGSWIDHDDGVRDVLRGSGPIRSHEA